MKLMRKITAVLLIVMMSALVLTGCGGSSSDDKIIGTWTCTALDMGSGDVLDQLGSTYSDSILFYALDDGTCLIDMAGQQVSMHWKWMEKNNDYKVTITLADYAEANGMTEEEMKEALQGSGSSDIDTDQSYRGTMDGDNLVLDMAVFYDEAQESTDSSADSSYKMEFTFSRTGDAPSSLDEVKTTSTQTTTAAADTTSSEE